MLLGRVLFMYLLFAKKEEYNAILLHDTQSYVKTRDTLN